MSSSLKDQKCYPYLPTEIVLHIIDFVPIDHILPFRAVSHSIKSHIETHLMYSYIRRTKFEYQVDPPDQKRLNDWLDDKDAQYLSTITASFSHLEDTRPVRKRINDGPRLGKPVWAAPRAVFKLDPQWFARYKCVRHMLPKSLQPLSSHLMIPSTQWAYIAPGAWCMHLDYVALEFDFDLRGQIVDSESFSLDLCYGTVNVDWKTMLSMFLKRLQRETELARRMEEISVNPQKTDPDSAFDLREHCIRAVRRERRRQCLGPIWVLNQRRADYLQELNSLVPLLGQPQFHGPLNVDVARLQEKEDMAMEHIMRLRNAQP
jgi:hypothetical protein